jgi:hypothetical protein
VSARWSARHAPHPCGIRSSVAVPYFISFVAINAIKGAASNRDTSKAYARDSAIELPLPGAPLIVFMGYKETFLAPILGGIGAAIAGLIGLNRRNAAKLAATPCPSCGNWPDQSLYCADCRNPRGTR